MNAFNCPGLELLSKVVDYLPAVINLKQPSFLLKSGTKPVECYTHELPALIHWWLPSVVAQGIRVCEVGTSEGSITDAEFGCFRDNLRYIRYWRSQNSAWDLCSPEKRLCPFPAEKNNMLSALLAHDWRVWITEHYRRSIPHKIWKNHT